MTVADLIAEAEAWADSDPDPHTTAELLDLVERADAGDQEALAELADAFDGTLSFGTAGLRGRLGPGSNRMNRVVVARAAAGLADYLRSHGGSRIVIGYDARRNSDRFAHDTAEIMAAAGVQAYVFPRHLPTPVLAFAIRHLDCDAGVMVTASHNPPDDNGYKVYLGDGSQIVPPADAEIAACIQSVGPVSDIARSSDYEVLGEDVLAAYLERAVSLLPEGGPREIRSVYTAMHGVGGEVFLRAVTGAGFPAPLPVAAQFEPDPRFPTVSFPNPEEPGAMDLALAAAQSHDADLIIANDPDADRCSVGIRTDDGWRMLTGDEVGALLGWWIAQRRAAGQEPVGTMAESIVSGTLLARIAEDAGYDFATTLTGFKWIARAPDLVFGYEEALGYCVDPAAVADKDGITASLLFLELAAHLAAQGRDVQDALDDLARRFGLYLTGPLAVRVADVGLIEKMMDRLRDDPPSELGGRPILRIEDLARGGDGLPPTDGLRFTMADARVIIRPSGTEPKLKCYLQVVVPAGEDLSAAKAAGQAELATVRASVAAALGVG
ncbi:MAG: phospho-sugar mutase [Actinobacteria bacterium]|nr:phospho-sugar mutase [Actinomycetota bacterium]